MKILRLYCSENSNSFPYLKYIPAYSYVWHNYGIECAFIYNQLYTRHLLHTFIQRNIPQNDMEEFLADIKTWNGRKLQLWEKFAMLVKAKKISRSFERKVCEKRRLSNNHFATNFNWNFSKRRECVLLYKTLSELEMGDLIFHSS